MYNEESIPVAILGATGAVGQKLIRLVEEHERFTIMELAASERNSGKRYIDACSWREMSDLPEHIANMRLKSTSEITAPWVLSALPSDVALEAEPMLAERGHLVISNASAHRMRDDVPLVIPEVNLSHLSLIRSQETKGKIITNPNCAAVFIALTLKPLMELGTIEHVSIVTMQAISGAGYPGVPACDILGNIIPNIAGEEEKIESELRKILGTNSEPAPFEVTVHTNRVPVLHGHMAVLHIRFSEQVSEEDVNRLFVGAEAASSEVYHLYDDPYSPQPRRHLHENDNGVHIGRIKVSANGQMVGLTALSHNLVRGAAGAALLNLEAVLDYWEARV